LGIQKGSIYLFEALNSLNIPLDNLEVLFIGKMLPEIEKLYNSECKRTWQYLGHKNHYDLANYIVSCDIAIQPSIQEGLSMVIPQIMSCGVPVIASTNTGGEDIIADGKTGFIVPIRDSNAIKERIELLYNDRGLLRKMQKNCTTLALDLSWDAYGKRYINYLISIK